MQLNQVLLDNPYLENDQSLQRYSEKDSDHASELKDKYNIYCLMKYNYLADFCKFYGFKRTRIEKRLHIKEYFTDNKEWWAENRKVNYEAYDKKFLHLIEEVVNGS